MKIISIECALFLRNANKAIKDAYEQKSVRMAVYYIDRAIADLEAARIALVADKRESAPQIKVETPPTETPKTKEV